LQLGNALQQPVNALQKHGETVQSTHTNPPGWGYVTDTHCCKTCPMKKVNG